MFIKSFSFVLFAYNATFLSVLVLLIPAINIGGISIGIGLEIITTHHKCFLKFS